MIYESSIPDWTSLVWRISRGKKTIPGKPKSREAGKAVETDENSLRALVEQSSPKP
jgi:hypothetical protein